MDVNDVPVASPPAFQNADKGGLKIISRGGTEMPPSENPPPVNQDPAPSPTPTATNSDPAPQANPSAAAQQTPPVQPQPTPEADPAPAVEDEEVDFFEYAAQQTSGIVKKPEDVFSLYQENQRLRTQLAEKPKIEFPNEQARLLYEYAVKFPGQEMSTARNVLHTLSLDANSLSPKEKQFEAFALENPKLTRDKARQYFDAMYEKKYGNNALEDDLTAQYEHDRETQKAEELIAKMQADFAKAQPSQQAGAQQQPTISPEEEAEMNRQVESVIGQFGGVKYQFFENDANSTVSIKMEDSDLQKFQTYLAKPQTFFEDLAAECADDKGNFSYDMYAMRMFEIMNIGRIREQSFKSGVTYGELKKVMEIKNTAGAKPAGESGAPAAAQAPKSMADAWKAAVKAKKVA